MGLTWVQMLGQFQSLVLKLKKYKGKKVKDQKMRKLSLNFFYSKIEIKNKSFIF